MLLLEVLRVSDLENTEEYAEFLLFNRKVIQTYAICYQKVTGPLNGWLCKGQRTLLDSIQKL